MGKTRKTRRHRARNSVMARYRTGALARVATMSGWFVMWTMEGTRLVHATSGPFDTKKEAQSYAREMSNVMKKATGDSNEGAYYLLKGGGSQ